MGNGNLRLKKIKRALWFNNASVAFSFVSLAFSLWAGGYFGEPSSQAQSKIRSVEVSGSVE